MIPDTYVIYQEITLWVIGCHAVYSPKPGRNRTAMIAFVKIENLVFIIGCGLVIIRNRCKTIGKVGRIADLEFIIILVL